MTNFEAFKRRLTPERLAEQMRCSECPLCYNECPGFGSIALNEDDPVKTCVDKLIDWFNQETNI